VTEESKATFFRQSGWVALATVLGGVFLTAVHIVVTGPRGMSEAEYSTFVTLLRVQLLISIPAAGIQTLLARQSASANSLEEIRRLMATFRRVVFSLIALWVVLVVVLSIVQAVDGQFYKRWKVSNAVSVWLTLAVGLVSLLLPTARGILMGRQDFKNLGWSIAIDGGGRFAAVMAAVFLGYQAAGGMAGVLIGLLCALALSFYCIRDLPWRENETLNWMPWLKQALPLAIGPGVLVIMFSADVLFVQETFPDTQTHFYMPVATVGLALFMFTTPMGMVMFPKLVSSHAEGKGNVALRYAFIGTFILGSLAFVILLLIPKLPLWIIYFKNPIYWQSSPLIPWYIASLFPLLLANVIIGNLLAKERLNGWKCAVLLLLAAGYAFALVNQRPQLLAMTNEVVMAKNVLTNTTKDAFQRVIITFGVFNLAFLAVAGLFTWLSQRSATNVAEVH
jgi:O-antigen/teichoic acid export membrane protein|tara:strand:+ start:471 stop:1820 length:1350 start_codon:yes stop_codon:yes gene_type:complete